MRLEARVIEARLRAPFVSASGSVERRALVLVSMTDDAGVVGYGEAAPLGTVPLDACLEAIGRYGEVLADASSSASHNELLVGCREAVALPQALAAVDLALWDLEGRRSGVPMWRLLGSSAGAPDPVEVNATVAVGDRAGAAAAVAAAVEAGYGCVKVKVGLGDDPGRLAAVRAAGGPSMTIRIDANGCWSPHEAVASLRALAPVGIELCEEPVSGLEAFELIRGATAVPVALDESAALPGALDRPLADAVCLKISSCGGISGVVDAAARARATGYDVYLASMLDGPLGIAAALHAAVAVRPARACGLATLGLFDEAPPFSVAGGRLAPPEGAGLGDGLLDWYR